MYTLKPVIKILLFWVMLWLSSKGFSQQWCPTGAKWHFTYTHPEGDYGYTVIRNTGDSVLNGKICHKMARERYRVPSEGSPLQFEFLGYAMTFEENGVVYIYDDYEEDFDTLFDFRARVGDRHPVSIFPASSSPILMRADVIDKGTVLAGGQFRTWMEMEYAILLNTGEIISRTDTLIEGIGLKGGYLFPVFFYLDMTGNPEGGPLRCYTDDTPFSYATSQAPCDFINPVPGSGRMAMYPLFPNPATEYFLLPETTDPCTHTTVVISNLQGRIQMESEVSDHKVRLPASLPAGLYLVKWERCTGSFQHFKMIKY